MGIKIRITENDIKRLVFESVKKVLNEKAKKNNKRDFVKGMEKGVSPGGFGGWRDMFKYDIDTENPNFNDEAFNARIKSDLEKVQKRRFNNYEEPRLSPKERLEQPGVRDRIKANNEKKNQLLLPFGPEEKASNISKIKNSKK